MIVRRILETRLAIRLSVIAAGAFLALLAVSAMAMLGQYHEMREARIAKLRAVTEMALSVAASLEKKVEAGQMTREEAIRQFRDIVRPLRFDEGTGYIFSYGMDGMTLVLGPTPEIEGTNRWEAKDAKGLPFVQEEVRVAKAGGGTLTYHYPKPGEKTALPKLSYVAPFAPWNMLAGPASISMTCMPPSGPNSCARASSSSPPLPSRPSSPGGWGARSRDRLPVCKTG